MRIIYLSREMSGYGAAFYQNDVAQELAKQQEVYFYGPGYPGYCETDNIQDVVAKSSFGRPDCVCVGHAWLGDKRGQPVDHHPALALDKLDVPRVMILNKEYTNLDAKLAYVRDSGINLVFTHHHKAESYQKRTGVAFVFWPFAVNPQNFFDRRLDRDFDLGFSGLLRNPTFPSTQSDLRIRVQKKLFHCAGELRLAKRFRYRDLNLFWKGTPSTRRTAKWNKLLYGKKRLPVEDYLQMLGRTRIWLNALSPVDLVGTRYYESMASRCLVLCPPSPVYETLFHENEHYVAFRQDLSDFDEKLRHYLRNDGARQAVVDRAHEHVMRNHIWSVRVRELTDEVQKRLL